MNCLPPCNGRLSTSHTFTADRHGDVRRCVCEKCGVVYTVRSVIVAADPGPGEGAVALAARLRGLDAPAGGVHNVSAA